MILVSRLVGGGCSGVFLRSGVCPWLLDVGRFFGKLW